MAKGKFRKEKKDYETRRELSFDLKEEITKGHMLQRHKTEYKELRRHISDLKNEKKRVPCGGRRAKSLKREKTREIKGLLKKLKVRQEKEIHDYDAIMPSPSDDCGDIEEEIEKLSCISNLTFSPRTPASSPLSFRHSRMEQGCFHKALQAALQA